MKPMQSPCQGCPHHRPGCHSESCAPWMEFRAKREAYLARRKAAQDAENDVDSVLRGRKPRRKKHDHE